MFVVFGMLLGDTLILDDLDCANKYRQEVSVVRCIKLDLFVAMRRFKDSSYFVTAHTFCASRDTRVCYGWCLLIQIFLHGLKLCGESRT